MVQTKEEKAKVAKAYREKNREKITAQSKAYREKNREKINAQRRVNRERNKERDKEKNAAYEKAYIKTPKGKRGNTLSNWKRRGTIGDLPKFYDERYLPATNCEVCHKEFKSTRDKNMDHDHDSGEIRWVLCTSCNCRDYWKKVLERKNNNSNIIYEPTKFHSDLQIQL